MCIKTNKVSKEEIGIWWVQKRFPRYGVPIWSLWPNIRWMRRNMCIYKCMLNVYKNQQNRQTGSMNLNRMNKYQISAINSCWEKCDEKCAYMFNVYKNQLNRQTGSRNLMGPKRFPRYGVPIWRLWPNIRSLSSIVAEKNMTKNVHICSMCIKTN
jgi:hypothetical protein